MASTHPFIFLSIWRSKGTGLLHASLEWVWKVFIKKNSSFEHMGNACFLPTQFPLEIWTPGMPWACTPPASPLSLPHFSPPFSIVKQLNYRAWGRQDFRPFWSPQETFGAKNRTRKLDFYSVQQTHMSSRVEYLLVWVLESQRPVFRSQLNHLTKYDLR